MSSKREDFERKVEYLNDTKSLLESYVADAGGDATGTFRKTVQEAGRFIENGTGKPKQYQAKTVTPTKREKLVVADEGYDALSQVTVEPIPEEYVLDSPELHPTLNAPTVSLNASGSLTVTDYRNGNFTEGYNLFVNSVKIASVEGNTIPLSDYEIADTDEISVEAYSSLFNNSPLSNIVTLQELLNGTPGLVYQVAGNTVRFTGIGSVTANKIRIASYVDGLPVTTIYYSALNGFSNKTVYLPDTITYFCFQSGANLANAVIVFGAYSRMSIEKDVLKSNTVYDFRKSTVVPTLQTIQGNTDFIALVNDEAYNSFVTDGNWAQVATNVYTESKYIEKFGAITWEL